MLGISQSVAIDAVGDTVDSPTLQRLLRGQQPVVGALRLTGVKAAGLLLVLIPGPGAAVLVVVDDLELVECRLAVEVLNENCIAAKCRHR